MGLLEDLFSFVSRKRFLTQKLQESQALKAFILEPILTPSGLVDDLTHDTGFIVIEPNPGIDHSLDFPPDAHPELDHAPDVDLHLSTAAIAPEHIELLPFIHDPEPAIPNVEHLFDSGIFTVGASGKVSIDYLFDGGGYQGQLAIFNLKDMEGFNLNTELGLADFIHEAAHRALSNSDLGHVVIADATEGAKFSGMMPSEWENHNFGEYQGVKTFDMQAGDRFAVMLVPNGTVQQVLDGNQDVDLRPLFSLHTVNPNEAFHTGQIADITGDGNTFVLEDLRTDHWTDRDYNDIIFQVRGATGTATHLDDVINPELDWRHSDVGQELIAYAQAQIEPVNPHLTLPEVPVANHPLIGIIDTGFSANNLDINYSNIILGRDYIDGDSNPLLSSGVGNEHGTHVLGIIGATQNNGIGIDGINDDAPIWVSRAVGSGHWSDSLVEFVDAAKASHQPNAVVNLSLDLTQINHDGSITTRYEFTPLERAAIEYARQNHVLIVAAAGNDGGVMSVLGQASQEFDNIITVGAADGLERAEYSSYGSGLDILAPGGTSENPILSAVGDGVGTMAGTSVAAAEVTGAISQVWAANPDLSYRQVIEILKSTATDLDAPGWDAETGSGLLNMLAAVELAKATQPQIYQPKAWLAPDTWDGEGTAIAMEHAVGKDDLYIAVGSGDVWQRNLKTGLQTLAYKGFPGEAFTDLAMSPDGRLFASTFAALHEINLTTKGDRFVGVLTPKPSIPNYAVTINALEFAEDGKLYGAEFETGNLYIIDPETAEMELIGNVGGYSSGDLVIDGTDKLYITVNSPVYGQGNDRLVLFDLKTHTSKVISNNLGMKDLYGLTMQNGKLVAYSRTGQQVTIDPNTGASFIGGTLPISSELRGVSLQLEDVPPPLPVPPVPPAPILPTAPLPGQKGVPEDAGKFRKTNVSKNGVVVHYYDNGYLIVQPSGEGFWYGRVQLYGLNRDVWDVAPISLTDPDGDDVALRAKLLNPGSFNSSFSVSRSGQIGGADDQNDYYKFTISSPSLVKLKLDGYPDGNKILLWNLLENSSDSGGSWDGNYTEISRILNPGTYHVQIYGSDDRQAAYNLQVSANNLEGRIFRGESGEAYLIKNGKRLSVPFLKVNEYLNRSWDSLEQIRQDDLEKIPFGGEYQPRWTQAIANEYAATSNLLGSETEAIVPAGRSPQGTTGYWQGFQNGTIHWSSKYGAVALWYDLQRVYNETGGSGGWLGFPTQRERDWQNGKRTDFEGGFIFWTPQLGARAYHNGETPVLTPPSPIDDARRILSDVAKQYPQVGAAISDVQDLGGNTFQQQFERAIMVWNGQQVTIYETQGQDPSPGSSPSTPVSNNDIHLQDFGLQVGSTNGVNLRYSPQLSDRSSTTVPYQAWMEFDGWTYGESVNDLWNGQPDPLWLKVKGQNLWVPSAYMIDYPPGYQPPVSSGGKTNNSGNSGSGNPTLNFGSGGNSSSIKWKFLSTNSSTNLTGASSGKPPTLIGGGGITGIKPTLDWFDIQIQEIQQKMTTINNILSWDWLQKWAELQQIISAKESYIKKNQHYITINERNWNDTQWEDALNSSQALDAIRNDTDKELRMLYTDLCKDIFGSSVSIDGADNSYVPIDGAYNSYEYYDDTDGGFGLHGGIDISAGLNVSAKSVVDGTVVWTEHTDGVTKGYGDVTIKDNKTGRMYIYRHLKSSDLKMGYPVNRGQEVGKVGNTGAKFIHLHYEVVEAGKDKRGEVADRLYVKTEAAKQKVREQTANPLQDYWNMMWFGQ